MKFIWALLILNLLATISFIYIGSKYFKLINISSYCHCTMRTEVETVNLKLRF